MIMKSLSTIFVAFNQRWNHRLHCMNSGSNWNEQKLETFSKRKYSSGQIGKSWNSVTFWNTMKATWIQVWPNGSECWRRHVLPINWIPSCRIGRAPWSWLRKIFFTLKSPSNESLRKASFHLRRPAKVITSIQFNGKKSNQFNWKVQSILLKRIS